MEKIRWDDSLATGIELIDSQHKALIAHMQTLSNAIAARQGAAKIAETLDFLIKYTRYHFDTEQRAMVANGYPGLAEHQQKHEELKETLGELVGDFEEDGATHALAGYLDNFLMVWLRRHIRETDQKLGDFFKARGIVPIDEA